MQTKPTIPTSDAATAAATDAASADTTLMATPAGSELPKVKAEWVVHADDNVKFPKAEDLTLPHRGKRDAAALEAEAEGMRGYRPSLVLGRPVLYRVPVPPHRPALVEPGRIVKVHPTSSPDEMPLVDLQVDWSDGQNGSRLVVNVPYDPDSESVGTWSLPY